MAPQEDIIRAWHDGYVHGAKDVNECDCRHVCRVDRTRLQAAAPTNVVYLSDHVTRKAVGRARGRAVGKAGR